VYPHAAYRAALALFLLTGPLSCESTLGFQLGPEVDDGALPVSTPSGPVLEADGIPIPECVRDEDGDGICDVADRCLLDGPLFTGYQDHASSPMLTVENVKLDGGSNVLTGVVRGSTFTLDYDWSYDSGLACCGCTTFVSLGYHTSQAPEVCQEPFTGCDMSGHTTVEMTAPTWHGTYFIGFNTHWDHACPILWERPPITQRFAAICVI
jgi:hypothetical protein